MNEEEISETLNQVVPHRDVPEGLLAGARRRRRNSRTLAGAAAVAVVAAIAIPLGLGLGGQSQPKVATPAPVASSTSDRQEVDGVLCPPGDTTEGATLKDMTHGYACGPVGVYGTTNESVQIPLSDALVADIVDEATSGQQPVEGPDTIGEPYFEYPDNVVSLVLLGADDSSLVMVGTPDGYTWYAPGHTQWEPSWKLADRIWAEMGRDSNCTVPQYLYPPDVSVEVYNAGAGAASVERVTQHLEEAGFAVTNTGETVSAAPGGSIIMRGANENGAGLWLVSSYLDTSGVGEMSREDDVVELLITSEFNDEADPFLTPTGLRAIDGSMACTSAQEVPASSSPATPAKRPSQTPPSSIEEQMETDQCDFDVDGRMVPTDLPNNTLPDGPVAVWLCNELRPLTEPLVGKDATQQVVDSFRKLPTSPAFDSYPEPGHAYVVVAYADGQRYTVEVETRSSDKVVWGDDQQHVRYGGVEWIPTLEQLWVEQRNDTPQNPPIAPKGGVCDNLYWNLGRTIDRYDADGALCTVVMTDSGSRAVDVPASLSLIEDFRTEAQKSKTPGLPPAGENPVQNWPLDIVVLVDDYGDRLSLMRGSGDPWYWREGNDTWEWTPSPDLAARLAQAFEEGRPSSQPTHS